MVDLPAPMRSVSLAVGLLSLISIVAPAASDNPTSSNTTQILTPEIDAFINGVLEAWNTAGGAAVAVVRLDAQGDWTVETKGYGVAKGDGSKVDSETIFSIGSNSKVRSLAFGRINLEFRICRAAV